MSLIVARKESAAILIVSDTHLSYADAKSSAGGQLRHPSTGVIKTLVVNNNTAVSFAGGETHADDAFKLIKHDTTLDDIKKILLQEHTKSNQATDFIIAIGGLKSQIFEVKDLKCSEVEMAWIGSKRAFSVFQAFMQGNVKSSRNDFIRIESVLEEAQTDLFSKMASAMDYVIEDDSVPEVDGFRISTIYTESKFQYKGYNHSYLSTDPIEIEIPEGVDHIEFPISHGTAQSGGYTINFFMSSDPRYIGIHILQGNFGIIYKQQESRGLMRPDIITNIDEVDFIEYAEDNYNIRPSVSTQDWRPKCVAGAREALNRMDYNGALFWYNKALRHSHGKDEAAIHYQKAVAYANLSRFKDVVMALSEAIKCDPNYQKPAFSLMTEIRKRGIRL